MTQEEFCDANLRPLKDSFQYENVTITENATTTAPVRRINETQEWSSTGSHACHGLLLISVILQVLMEVNSAMKMKGHYVNSNLFVVRLPCIVLSTVLLVPFSFCGFILGIKMVSTWQCGIVALLIQWFHIIHTINTVPQFSIFTTITKDFILGVFKGLMFIGMIVSLFAFIFHMLLQDQPAFQTIPQSLVKTVVWLMGDLGYDDTFMEELAYPVLVNVVFLVFICTVAVFIVTLIKTPSLDEKEVLLNKTAERATLILNLDVCYPCYRKVYAVGKYFNKKKNPWIVTMMENFLTPKGVMRSLTKGCERLTLMNIEQYKKDNEKHWIVIKFEKILQFFNCNENESVNSEYPHPVQDQSEEQTEKKLDQLLEICNQLNSNYQKVTEQILELKQQLDSMKQKQNSRSSIFIA